MTRIGRPTFEIGMTYEKDGRYFIAVDDKLLASFENGNCSGPVKYTDHRAARKMTVGRLCRAWNINARQLDSFSDRWFPRDSVNGVEKRHPSPAASVFRCIG